MNEAVKDEMAAYLNDMTFKEILDSLQDTSDYIIKSLNKKTAE